MSLGIDWLKAIQLKSKYLFGIALVGGVILFLPDKYAQFFGITDFRDSYRSLIGLVTLASTVFFMIQFISECKAHYSRKKNIEEQKRFLNVKHEKIIRSLDSIPADSWIIVAYCLINNQQTITLGISDPDIGQLTAMGIFELTPGLHSQISWPYKIPFFLWEYLHKNGDEFLRKSPFQEDDLRKYLKELDYRIHRNYYLFM